MPFTLCAKTKVPSQQHLNAAAKQRYRPMPIIGLGAATERLNKKAEVGSEIPSACKRIDSLGSFREDLNAWTPDPSYNPGANVWLISRSPSIPTLSLTPKKATESAFRSVSMDFQRKGRNTRSMYMTSTSQRSWDSGLDIPLPSNCNESESDIDAEREDCANDSVLESPLEMKVREALNAPSHEAPLEQTEVYHSPMPSRRAMKAETPEVPARKASGNLPTKLRRSLFSIFTRQQKQTQKSPAALAASSRADRKATMAITKQSPFAVSPPRLTTYSFADDLVTAAADNTLDVRRMEEKRRKWGGVRTKSLDDVHSQCSCKCRSKISTFFKKKWMSPQGKAGSKSHRAHKPCVHCNANPRSMSAPLIGSESEASGDRKPLRLTMIADSLKVSSAVAGRMLDVHTHNIIQGCPAEAEAEMHALMNSPSASGGDRRVSKVSELLGTSLALSRRMLQSIPYTLRIDGLGPNGYFEDSLNAQQMVQGSGVLRGPLFSSI